MGSVVDIRNIEVLFARAVGAIHDEIAVGSEVGVLIIAHILGEALNIGAVGAHYKDIKLALIPARKGNLFTGW